MAEYIEREKVMQAIGIVRNIYSEAKNFVAVSAVDKVIGEIVDEVPTANVAPVVNGRWTQVDDTKCRCSNCDIIALIGLYPHGDKNYCPNCGAKMDEEQEG